MNGTSNILSIFPEYSTKRGPSIKSIKTDFYFSFEKDRFNDVSKIPTADLYRRTKNKIIKFIQNYENTEFELKSGTRQALIRQIGQIYDSLIEKINHQVYLKDLFTEMIFESRENQEYTFRVRILRKIINCPYTDVLHYVQNPKEWDYLLLGMDTRASSRESYLLRDFLNRDRQYMTSTVYPLFSGMARLSMNRFTELGLEGYITEGEVEALKQHILEVLFAELWKGGERDGSAFICHDHYMNDEPLIRLAFDALGNLYATASLLKNKGKIKIDYIKSFFPITQFTDYLTQTQLPSPSTCTKIISKLKDIINNNPNDKSLIAQCEKTISLFEAFLTRIDLLELKEKLLKYGGRAKFADKYKDMRKFFESSDEVRSTLKMFLYSRDLGMEPIFLDTLSGSTVMHHLNPYMGWALNPSLLHLTTKSYHGHYPSVSTRNTHISVRDSSVFTEALRRLIELGLKRDSKVYGPTGGLWVNMDDITEIFKEINGEIGGDPEIIYRTAGGQYATDVWINGLRDGDGNLIKEPNDPFLERLNELNERIDFLKDEKAVISGKEFQIRDNPLKYLLFVKQYYPGIFDASKKGAAVEVANYYRLLEGKIKTHRDLFLSDYLLATELGVLKVSKRFGSTYLGPRAVSTDELKPLLLSEDDVKLMRRVFPIINNKELYWDLLTGGQRHIDAFFS